MPVRMRAVEFFSGIGAFRYAAGEFGIEVIEALDQGEDANRVYEFNFGHRVNSRNLDSIKANEIPPADLWWLSPPCTPYTRRGKMLDEMDSRSASLRNLIAMVAEHRPRFVLLENVAAFADSAMFAKLVRELEENGYTVQTLELCPTMFGVPMKRPRFFVVAHKGVAVQRPYVGNDEIAFGLADVIDGDADTDVGLRVEPGIVDRFESSLEILDPATAEYAICFTSGYGTSLRASGSYLRTAHGGVRRFSPEEILRLFGFGSDFSFPADMPLQARWRLIGNSVEQRCIRHLLSSIKATDEWVETYQS